MPVRKIRKAWWVDIRFGFRRYRKRSPTNSAGGAREYEAYLRHELAHGENINRPRAPETTFADFAKRWLATYVTTNNKPSEQRTKRILLERHLLPALGARPLAGIGPSAIEEYKARKLATGLRPKTVNNHLAVLSKCLRTAEEWGNLSHAPRVRLLRAPAPEIDFLSPEESARLLADDEEPISNGMVLVGLRAGLRLGELLALERRDANLERRNLTVARSIVNGVVGTPKNYRVRHIPMTRELREFFAAAPGTGLLFGRADGRPQSYSIAEKAMTRLCKRTGIRRIGWHRLRHTFASDLVAANVALPAVQKLLGHASITTTMRYAHLAPSALRGAIDTLEEFISLRPTSEFGQPVVNASPKAVESAVPASVA